MWSIHLCTITVSVRIMEISNLNKRSFYLYCNLILVVTPHLVTTPVDMPITKMNKDDTGTVVYRIVTDFFFGRSTLFQSVFYQQIIMINILT